MSAMLERLLKKETITVIEMLEGCKIDELSSRIEAQFAKQVQVDEWGDSITDSITDIAVKAFKQYEDFPEMLRAQHIGAILDISVTKAYEVLHSDKCPSITIGKSRRVSKSAFIKYIVDCQGQDLID